MPFFRPGLGSGASIDEQHPKLLHPAGAFYNSNSAGRLVCPDFRFLARFQKVSSLKLRLSS